MKLFNLFDKKSPAVTTQENDIVTDDERSVQEVPNTILVFTPEQKATLSLQDQQYYTELNEKMPPLRFDELNFVPVEAGVTEEGYYVRVFIRNGQEEDLTITETGLQLIDASGETAAEGLFSMRKFGSLRLGETRLWHFSFRKDMVKKAAPDLSRYTVAISSIQAQKATLELDMPEEWSNSMSAEQLESWRRMIVQLPNIEPNTINFRGVQAMFDEEGNLRVVLVIQNATPKDVSFHKLPLFVQDHAGDLVAEGLFELNQFTVGAHTIKPWMFVFNKELVKKTNPDLSRWIVFTK